MHFYYSTNFQSFFWTQTDPGIAWTAERERGKKSGKSTGLFPRENIFFHLHRLLLCFFSNEILSPVMISFITNDFVSAEESKKKETKSAFLFKKFQPPRSKGEAMGRSCRRAELLTFENLLIFFLSPNKSLKFKYKLESATCRLRQRQDLSPLIVYNYVRLLNKIPLSD